MRWLKGAVKACTGRGMVAFGGGSSCWCEVRRFQSWMLWGTFRMRATCACRRQSESESNARRSSRKNSRHRRKARDAHCSDNVALTVRASRLRRSRATGAGRSRACGCTAATRRGRTCARSRASGHGSGEVGEERGRGHPDTVRGCGDTRLVGHGRDGAERLGGQRTTASDGS